MLWICDDCGTWQTCDPCSHSDTGGVIEVQGPNCVVCGIMMDYAGEEDDLGDGPENIDEGEDEDQDNIPGQYT